MNTYYLNCAFPKPGNTRKKKKCNGYKDKSERYCRYHGTPYAERHEVFPGSNRQTSIDYGFQVDVCPACHRELQDNITDWAKEQNRSLRRHFQKKFMSEQMQQGYSRETALQSWMILIGRNYIEELMPQ